MNPVGIETAGSIGDLLLSFGPISLAPGRANSTAWLVELEGAGWRLSGQPVSPQWHGFPLTNVTAGPWRGWLLGELCGMSSGGAECRLAVQEVLVGVRKPAALNGNFLLFAWNEEARQWHAWTSRLGTLHAYYAEQGGKAALSTVYQAAASAASRRQLDWVALTGFFKFGLFPGDRTFFDDVRILRPASHYVFGAKGDEVSAEPYWEWHHEPDHTRSYEDTVGQFAGLFQSVMADLFQRSALGPQRSAFRIALPISGGLDSRCAAAALRGTVNGAQAAGVWAYSYGYSDDSAETRIARKVAGARGIPFEAFTVQPYLFDRVEHILDCVEGFQDITQCRQAAINGEIGQHADYLIGGHLGDLLMDDIGLAGRAVTPAEIGQHAIRKIQKPGNAWLLENLCRQQVRSTDPGRAAEELLHQELSRLDRIDDADFRVKCLKMQQWVFRWTNASLRMFQSAAFPRLPFYDNRLIDLFCTVPTAMVSKRRLQIDYLKRFAPDLARVEWQAYGANLYDYQRSAAWSLPRRAVKKALRLVTGKKIIERNWEVQFGGQQGEEGLKHWLLRPNLRLHDLVSRQKIEALLSDFRASPLKDGRGYTVSMLLTFSAWLEHSAV